MATINDPTIAANATRAGEVATGATGALHTTLKPIPASVGHYRVTHRCALVNVQAANSRLFEVRNAHASNFIVALAMRLMWINSAAHTAFIEDSLDVFKVTGFTVIDPTNTVTLTPSLKRLSMSAPSAQVRGVTVAGAAAGMTGGTLVKDTGPIAQLPRILNQAVMAVTETTPRIADFLEVFHGEHAGAHPFVFAPNEGFIIENRVVLGAAAGSSVYIDFDFAEVTAY